MSTAEGGGQGWGGVGGREEGVGWSGGTGGAGGGGWGDGGAGVTPWAPYSKSFTQLTKESAFGQEVRHVPSYVL